MALDFDIRAQATEYFAQEAPELLASMEQDLLRLKSERTIQRVHSLMRAAHSLKGGAATVGFEPLSDLAHRLEDTFKGLYDESVVIDPTLENLIFCAYDQVRNLTMVQIQGQPVGDLQPAHQIFAQLVQRLGDPGDAPLLDSVDLGVDIVASIFETDITQGLSRVQQALGQTHLAQELQEVAEIFTGLGELTNLPGFTAIAEATLQALAHQPAQAEVIAQLALQDWQAGQTLVLEGDRTEGGTPSTALRNFSTPSHSPAVELYQPVATPKQPWLVRLKSFFTALLPAKSKPLPTKPDLAVPPFVSRPEPTAAPSLTLQQAFTALTESSVEPVLTEQTDLLVIEPKLELEPDLPPAETFEEVVAAFDQLPVALELAPPTPVVLSPLPVEATPPRPTVRVDLERMEQLNNLVGELVINRNGLAMQQERLEGTLRDLDYRFERFEQVGRQLQGLCDRLLVAPQRPEHRPGFDALEFDTYSTLHAAAQEALDEMGQLVEIGDALRLTTEANGRNLEQHRRMLTNIRDGLMWARMLPLHEIFSRLPRMVHDLSNRYGKNVALEIRGAQIPVDRIAAEKLADPLVHLVRNAFDHGLESPTQRTAQGKSPVGKISLYAYHRGAQTVIEVRDDGQGLDLVKIQQRGVALGLITATETDPERVLACMFEPGFSTRTEATELSGRGMGLDVVKRQLAQIKGQVRVVSVPNQGTTFYLTIPLTLTVAKLLVFLVRGRAWAAPLDAIAEVVVPRVEDIKQTGGKKLLVWREHLLAFKPLDELFGYGASLETEDSLTPLLTTGQPVIILRTGDQYLALGIDHLITEQELVIKPFGTLFTPPDYVYGCTVLGDGTLVPVLEAEALGRQVLFLPPVLAPVSLTSSKASIMVVDDSSLQRQTVALVLKKAGYAVLMAKDGREGLETLAQHLEIALVICDIEMPRMDGFEFLKHAHQLNPGLPVVMLTSRNGSKHRDLAIELGAKGYLTKPFMPVELLAVANTHAQAAS